MKALISTIALFCSFSDKTIPVEKKEMCMEFMVNCAINKDSKTNPELVEKCKVNWRKNENN